MLLRGILLQTFLVIVASFVLATVESQTVVVYPPSVGVFRARRETVLGCHVTGLPTNTYIEWIYYPTWRPTGITIYSTYDGINNDPTNFTVCPMTTVGNTQTLDLVINMAKPELATHYVCNLTPIPGHGKSINVVVIAAVDCPITPAIIDIIEYYEGVEANLSCSVNYYDSTQTYAPRITWKRDGQKVPGVVHISESLTRKTAILTKNVTSADDNKKFVCVVDFDFANSNPRYTDYCSIGFYVTHAVSQITFYPPSSAEAPIDVAVGEVIDCIPNGKPAPMIEWYDQRWNLVSGWRKLAVTTDMRSWRQPITLHCRARNRIDKGMKSKYAMVEASYTFNVVDAASTVQCGGVEAWVIAVAVIVPIVVLATMGIAVFCIIRLLMGVIAMAVIVPIVILAAIEIAVFFRIGHQAWVIAVAVIVTTVVLAAISIAVFFIIRLLLLEIAVAVIVPIVIKAAIAIADFFGIIIGHRHRPDEGEVQAMKTTKCGSTSALLFNY